MCTILLLSGMRADAPLVVAANRDEFYARPARGAALLPGEPRVVAGVDLVSGGTWMGINAGGLLVAVTNQRDEAPADRALASRGSIVIEALRCRSLAEVDALVARLDGSAYNPFNLLYGDGRELRVAYGRRDRARCDVVAVSPGVHVLPSDVLDAESVPKVGWLRAEGAALVDVPLAELGARLIDVMASHRKPGLDEIEPSARFEGAVLRELHAPCVHTESYGTRSSSIAILEPGRVLRYLYADGPPCRTPFTDVTSLLG